MSLREKIIREMAKTYSQYISSWTDYIAENIQPLSNSRFVKVGESTWVYPTPLKSSINLGKYTYENKIIKSLNLSEQIILLDKLKDKLGFKTILGSSEENFKACLSRETKEYRKEVLKHFYVFTGEIALKESGEENIRKVLGINLTEKESEQKIISYDGREIEIEQNKGTGKFYTQYIVGPILRKGLPSEEGYFNSFNIVPTDQDLRDKGKFRWGGKEFDYGLSAIQNYATSGVDFAILSQPPLWSIRNVIPIWTDENPKK